MAGAFVGVAAIIFGLLIAPSGQYILYGIYGIALLAGLYLGIQGAAAVPAIPFLQGIPFAQELVGGLIVGSVGVGLISLAIGLAGGILPMVYGFRLGTDLFGESLLAFLPALIAPVVAVVVLFLGLWILSALIGGVLVSTGVHITFSVGGSESTSMFTDIAGALRSVGFPELVPAIIESIGAVGQSSLLIGIAALVAIAGVAGHFFILQQLAG